MWGRRDNDDEWDIARHDYGNDREPPASPIVHAWRHGALPIAAAVTICWLATGWTGANPLGALVTFLLTVSATGAACLWAWRQWRQRLPETDTGIPQSFEAYESGIAAVRQPRRQPPDADMQRRLRNLILILAGITFLTGLITSLAGAPANTAAAIGSSTDSEIEETLARVDFDVRSTTASTSPDALRQSWMTRGSLGRVGNSEVIGVVRDTAWVTVWRNDGTSGTYCLRFTTIAEDATVTACTPVGSNISRTVPVPSRNSN